MANGGSGTGLPWTWAVLLATLLVGLPLAQSPPPTAAAEQPPAQPTPSPGTADDCKTPLTFSTFCKTRIEALDGNHDVEYLIVLLPDPFDTLYAREFDLYLGGLRQGMESLGYVQDVHCLPWTAEAKTKSNKPSEQVDYRKFPGRVLYRKAAEGPNTKGRLQVALLVGETPSGGVHPEAFKAALEIAGHERGEVRILGPIFSGSSGSLVLGLKSWAKGSAAARVVEVISGTASSVSNEAILEAPTAAEDRLKISYASAARTSDQLRRAFFRHFVPDRLGVQTCVPASDAGKCREHENEKVAILVESSIYGDDFKEDGFLILPFPMHVSALRVESASNRKAAAAASGSSGEPRRTLELALEDEEATRDTLPFFDHDRSTRTLELAMLNILDTLLSHRVELVVIVSSNTKDKLFLSEVLAREVPNVRQVTFESDLLLAHPDFYGSTRGMLVVSSFPPNVLDPDSSGTNRESKQPRSHRIFTSDAARGIYEAVLRLVGDGIAPAADCELAAAWVSVNARGRLMPLWQMGTEERKHAGKAQAERELARIPRSWILSYLLLSGVLIYLGARLFWAMAKGTPAFGGLIPERLFSGDAPPKSSTALKAHRGRQMLVLLLILCVSLLYLLPTLVVGTALWTRGQVGALSPLDVLLGSLICLTLVVLVLLGYMWVLLRVLVSRATVRRLLGELRAEPDRPRRWLFWAGCGLGALLAAYGSLQVAGFASWFVSLDQPLRVAFVERSTHIGAGVSAIVPLVLLIVSLALWLFLGLRRYGALPESEQVGRMSFAQKACAELRRALTPWDFHVVEYWWVWLIGLVVPAGWFLVYSPTGALSCREIRRLRFLYGVETMSFDSLASILVLLGLLVALATGLALYRGWTRFGEILERLRALDHEGGQKGWIEEVSGWLKPGSRELRQLRAKRDEALAALQAARDAGKQTVAAPASTEWVVLLESAPSAAGPTDSRERAFFARQTAIFIRTALEQLLSLAAYLGIGFMLLLLAVMAYPFEPSRALTFYAGTLLSAAVCLIAWFLLAAEKNELLSNLVGTKPGEIGLRQLLPKLGTLIGLPIFTLLLSQFPELRQALISWIKPIFDALQ